MSDHFDSQSLQPRPDLKLAAARLETFRSWPIQIQRPSKLELSESGFYYIGYSDLVQCFSCGVRLCEWLTTDQPWVEHEKHSPNCMFLNMVKCVRTGKDLGGSNVFDRDGTNRFYFGHPKQTMDATMALPKDIYPKEKHCFSFSCDGKKTK